MDDSLNQPSTSRGFINNDIPANNENSIRIEATKKMYKELHRFIDTYGNNLKDVSNISLTEELAPLMSCMKHASFISTADRHCEGRKTTPFVQSAAVVGISTLIIGKQIDKVCEELNSIGDTLQQKEHILIESYRELQSEEDRRAENTEGSVNQRRRQNEEARQRKLEARKAKELAAQLLVTVQTPGLIDLEAAGPSGIQQIPLKNEGLEPEITESERIRRIQDNEHRREQLKLKEQERIARTKQKEAELRLEKQKEDLELADDLGINPTHLVDGLSIQQELVNKKYENTNNLMNLKTEEINEHIKGNSYTKFELPIIYSNATELKEMFYDINNYGLVSNDNKYFNNTESLFMSDKLITCDSTVPALPGATSPEQLDIDPQINNSTTNASQTDASIIDPSMENDTAYESLENADHDMSESTNTSVENVDIETIIPNSTNTESMETEPNGNGSQETTFPDSSSSERKLTTHDKKLDISFRELENPWKIPIKHLKRKCVFETGIKMHHHNTRKRNNKILKESPKTPKKSTEPTLSEYIEKRRDSGSCSISLCSETPTPLPVGDKSRISEGSDMGYVTSSPMTEAMETDLTNSQNLSNLSQLANSTFDSGVGMYCTMNAVLGEIRMPLEQSNSSMQDSNEEADTNSRLKRIYMHENLKKKYQISDNKMAERVREWNISIKPVIRKDNDRCHFNQAEYEKYILDQLNRNCSRDRFLTLAEIMRGKPPEDISRFLLACLQLANLRKVIIIQTKEHFLEPESIKLKCILPEMESKSDDLEEADSAITDMSTISSVCTVTQVASSSSLLLTPEEAEDAEMSYFTKPARRCYSRSSSKNASSTPKSYIITSTPTSNTLYRPPVSSTPYLNSVPSTSRRDFSLISTTNQTSAFSVEKAKSSAMTRSYNTEVSSGFNETSIATASSSNDSSSPKKFVMSVTEGSNEHVVALPVLQSSSRSYERAPKTYSRKRLAVQCDTSLILLQPNSLINNQSTSDGVGTVSMESEANLVTRNSHIDANKLGPTAPTQNLRLQMVNNKSSSKTALSNISDPDATSSRAGSLTTAVTYNVSNKIRPSTS